MLFSGCAQRLGERALKSTEQQKVETRVVESKQVIVIEQAKPDVVYSRLRPGRRLGRSIYPYPPIYYPRDGATTLAAAAISFGIGFAMGAFWGGGWGWGCGGAVVTSTSTAITISIATRTSAAA